MRFWSNTDSLILLNVNLKTGSSIKLSVSVFMPSPESLHKSDLQQRKVWVLAPYLHTGDANVDYYYDFSQSIQEYTKVFAELDLEWKWQPVTMNDYQDVIGLIAETARQELTVVLNLCDGDELNGTPGLSVL